MHAHAATTLNGGSGDVDGSGSERPGTDPNGAIQCEHAGKVPKGATGNLSVRFVPDQVRVACACTSVHLLVLANFHSDFLTRAFLR